MNNIVIGSDHGGFALKKILIEELNKGSFAVTDIGCFNQSSVHYPQIASLAIKEVLSRNCHRGILICGTGIGMSIVANRYQGIRATLCTDHLTAKLSREHNNSNFLVLGGRVLGDIKAIDIMEVWLKTSFLGDRHQTRLELIDQISD